VRALQSLAIAALVLLGTSSAGAAQASFQLVFDGKHNAALLHEGTFTTTATWCSSGSAADVAVDDATLTATRRFTCAEGGDFTAKVGSLRAEHGGSGRWQIVAGTGPLASLRGQGTFVSMRLAGSLDDPGTITFRSTWDGVADFDDVPPVIAIAKPTVRKLRRPIGAYSVRVALALTDAGGGRVSYTLQVIEPRTGKPMAFRSGQTSTGPVTLSLRLKPPRVARVLRITVDAADAVGNGSTLAKTFRLR